MATMTRAFTVDRNGSLSPGLVLDRIRHLDLAPPELQKHVDDLFPAGVTRHGDSYILNGQQPAVGASGNIELLFEYVRRTRFSGAPSRFESLFASPSLQAAREFRADFGHPAANIWEVETASESFRADMHCLTLGGSLLVTSYRAERYWSQLDAGMGAQPHWELLLEPPVRVLKRVDPA